MSDWTVPVSRPDDEVAGVESPSRYDLGRPDGSWWVVGWDPSLGTSFAQRVHRDPVGDGERILDDRGLDALELTTVDVLEQVIGRRLPAATAAALTDDARQVPAPDPLSMVDWALRQQADKAIAADPDHQTREAWRTAAARIAQRAADTTNHLVQTLPAGPVAGVLEALGKDADHPPTPEAPRDESATGELTDLAANLGLDRALARERPMRSESSVGQATCDVADGVSRFREAVMS